MIKPDIVVIWPLAFDYPPFRQMIVDNRHLFNKIIVSFTRNSVARNYGGFLSETHPDWTFIDVGYSRSPERMCWYDSAVNGALDQVTSDHVLFLEQDFIPTEKNFFEELLNTDYDLAYFIDGTRKHLCCFLAKMELVNKTNRMFSIVPNKPYDCFDKFTEEICSLTTNVREIVPPEALHIAGLTFQYYCSINNKWDVIVKNENFIKYLKKTLTCTVPIRPTWIEITNNILNHYEMAD